MRAIRDGDGRAIRAPSGRGLVDQSCCCDVETCDHWYKAVLCQPVTGCASATPEVYIRCDYRCRSGSGLVVRVGPWAICYTVDTAVKYMPDPGTGVPPQPGFGYMPGNAWIIREIDFDCSPNCSCGPLPQVWYGVKMCECDQHPSPPPLWLDCETYHTLVEQARALQSDPLVCIAFSGFVPSLGSFCFTLEGGVVYTQYPGGLQITAANAVVGGCCRCCGFPVCETFPIDEWRWEDCAELWSRRRDCCCNPATAVSTSLSTAKFYTTVILGNPVPRTLWEEEIIERRLDGDGFWQRLQVLPRHPSNTLMPIDQTILVPHPRCDRPAVLHSRFDRPLGGGCNSSPVVGFGERLCEGARVQYDVYGDQGFGSFVLIEVVGAAEFAGDLGVCVGCSVVPGDSRLSGGLPGTTRYL